MPTCYRHPDRETGLSCSECGRPICTECMTMAPVGIRCPDHAGNAAGRRRLRGPVEHYLGRSRFLGLYLVAGLAGSAGALLQSPTGVTVGASGAIFGILGALLILEWQATGKLGGQAMTLIVINLAFSFTFAGISWGGHVGGLIGGILATLAFARWGRGHAAYGRLGLGGALGLVVIAAASVALAYWKVRGLA